MIGLNHVTVVPSNFRKQEGGTWKATVDNGESVNHNAFTVTEPTKFQALNMAWKHVELNPEKFGIEEWRYGELTINVKRSD